MNNAEFVWFWKVLKWTPWQHWWENFVLMYSMASVLEPVLNLYLFPGYLTLPIICTIYYICEHVHNPDETIPQITVQQQLHVFMNNFIPRGMTSRFILKQLIEYSFSISMHKRWLWLHPHQLSHDTNLALSSSNSYIIIYTILNLWLFLSFKCRANVVPN